LGKRGKGKEPGVLATAGGTIIGEGWHEKKKGWNGSNQIKPKREMGRGKNLPGVQHSHILKGFAEKAGQAEDNT